MKRSFFSILFLLLSVVGHGQMKSIRSFGVLPQNLPEVNARCLQKAIDWASRSGAALFVDPAEQGYPIASGIVLKQNVSLIGVHGPTGRGTRHPEKEAPVGSLFLIQDAKAPFITVESSTQIRGIQFWYPEQTNSDPACIISYPPTIQGSRTTSVQGVTLSCLTFYGEYVAMDFNMTSQHVCEQILFEHCYGYPLSGEFIRIDYCYDIPRLLHCHVNPANMRLFGRTFSKAVVDAVAAKPSFAFAVDHTDNAQLIDLFTFGTHGGIYLGKESYGQLTNFNLDCVAVGIHKIGGGSFNRNWQIAQGSIIANVGCDTADIHPIIIEGEGHTAISNVEAFSGLNGAITALGKSFDFLLIRGDRPLTVSLSGCRMRNYTSSSPLTVRNPQASVQATACVDREEKFYNTTIEPQR